MKPTSACPEPEVLWALLDKELPQGRELSVRMHLDSCEHCRDFVISARRLEGTLRTPVPRHAEPEFEDEFRSRLMKRLATSGEERRARSFWGGRGRGRAVAAALFLALVVGAGSWGVEAGGGAAEVRREARTEMARLDQREARRAAARLELVEALHDFGRERPGASAAIGRLERRFADLELGLADEVTSLLEFADQPLLRGAVAFMGRHRSRRYLPALQGLIERGESPTTEIEERALLALAEQGTPSALAALEELARDARMSPARRDLAIEALIRRPSVAADRVLEGVLRNRGPRTGASIVARLIERGDKSAVAMLKELYLSGHQSDRLVTFLVGRSETPRWIRRRLASPRTNAESARRLIRLAGETGDAGTLRALVSWIDREEPKVLAALVQIAAPGALDTVAGRLVLGARRRAEGPARGQHDAAIRALRRAGPEVAAYFLRRVRETQGQRSRRFLLAVGAAGDPSVLPALRSLVARDELEVEAIEAIGLLDAPEARAALRELLSDEDAGVRRAARRVLDAS